MISELFQHIRQVLSFNGLQLNSTLTVAYDTPTFHSNKSKSEKHIYWKASAYFVFDMKVAQWLAPQTIERLVDRIWLWVPTIHWGERRWRSAKEDSLYSPRFTQPNVQEIVPEG